MTSTTIDATTAFNSTGKYNIDLSGWEYAVVGILTPATDITFNGTNNGNAKTGASDGNAHSAINWQPLQLTNVATGTGVTSTSGDGNFKLNVGTKYLQLSGTTAASVIIQLSTKI